MPFTCRTLFTRGSSFTPLPFLLQPEGSLPSSPTAPSPLTHGAYACRPVWVPSAGDAWVSTSLSPSRT